MKNSPFKLIAFIIAVLTTVFFGPLILPLAWMIPMTLYIYHAYKENKRVSPQFIISTTIFMVNPAITVFLLLSENLYTRRKWIYYASLVDTILMGPLLIPLIWMIPLVTRLYKASNAEYEPNLAFRIAILILFGYLPTTFVLKGVLLLIENKKDIYE